MPIIIAVAAILLVAVVAFTRGLVADPLGALGSLVLVGLSVIGLGFLVAGLLAGNGANTFTGLVILAGASMIGRALRRRT